MERGGVVRRDWESLEVVALMIKHSQTMHLRKVLLVQYHHLHPKLSRVCAKQTVENVLVRARGHDLHESKVGRGRHDARCGVSGQ